MSGGPSNHHFQAIIQSLATGEGRQARHRDRSESGWPEGRRKFGTVSTAIKTVLARSDNEMRIEDVHREVERLLGGAVSFQSVADFLTKNSMGPTPLFEKPKYGRYRLKV